MYICGCMKSKPLEDYDWHKEDYHIGVFAMDDDGWARVVAE